MSKHTKTLINLGALSLILWILCSTVITTAQDSHPTCSPNHNVTLTIGLATPNHHESYNQHVISTINQAAAAYPNVTIIEIDNANSTAQTVLNIDTLHAHQVSGIIQLVPEPHTNQIINTHIEHHNIPQIHIAHTASGRITGNHLSDWINQHWNGHVDYVLITDRRPPTTHSDVARAVETLQTKTQHPIEPDQITWITTTENPQYNHDTLANYLNTLPANSTIVSLNHHDADAASVLEIINTAEHLNNSIVTSQQGGPIAQSLILQPGSRMLGSSTQIHLASATNLLDTLVAEISCDTTNQNQPSLNIPPPAFIDRSNVCTYYGNDWPEACPAITASNGS